MQEKVFLSRISMSAKQEEGRIEHHFIDIKKIFPMHPDSGFQHFVVFLPSNSGEDRMRPGERTSILALYGCVMHRLWP